MVGTAKRIGAAACLCAVLGAVPAAGGAWTQQPGAGQFISSFGHRSNAIPGFGGGDVEDDSTFVSLYLEYGLMEGLTLGAISFVEIVSSETGANNADAGLFLRKRLWQGEGGDVASVQVGAVQSVGGLLGGNFDGPNGDPTQEVSVRAQYGRGFGFGWGSAFLSLEAGYHLQTDGDDDEIRIDATVGGQPWGCCMLILSVFSTVPLGRDEAAVKIAPSVTYGFYASEAAREAGKRTTIQLSLSQDVLALDEGVGFQIGIWEPF